MLTRPFSSRDNALPVCSENLRGLLSPIVRGRRVVSQGKRRTVRCGRGWTVDTSAYLHVREGLCCSETPVKLNRDDPHAEFKRALFLVRKNSVEIPKEIPLLFGHRREVRLGSVRDLFVLDGAGLLFVRFSMKDRALKFRRMFDRGEVKCLSAGSRFRDSDCEFIEKGSRWEGFKGPLVVVRRWTLTELSLCLRGRDPHAAATSPTKKPEVIARRLIDEHATAWRAPACVEQHITEMLRGGASLRDCRKVLDSA